MPSLFWRKRKMLSLLLAVVAAACFVIMIIALLVTIRLAVGLERLEREYELLKESQQPHSRRRKRREVAELTLAPVRY
jgi:uncharacterized membrane protein YciS (DUF1049 family)